MASESENNFRFILENILCIEDSSRVTIELINIIEGSEWQIPDNNDEVIFLSKNFKSEAYTKVRVHFKIWNDKEVRRKLSINESI